MLYVGTNSSTGNVYAIKDGKVFIVAGGLNMPNGVALLGGALHVAQVSRVLRFDDIDRHYMNAPKPVVINDTFPTDTHHGWKFIRFSRDGKWLYVPVGAPCNICLKEDKRYASIMRMHPDGSGLEIFARSSRAAGCRAKPCGDARSTSSRCPTGTFSSRMITRGRSIGSRTKKNVDFAS